MADENEDQENRDEKENAEGVPGEGGEGASKKGLSKKMTIILALGLVVILGGAGAAYFFLHGKMSEQQKEDQAKDAAANEKSKITYYALGDLLVNLSGEGKHPSFLKVKISLELADEKDLPLMDSIKPRIIDNFQVYLRELRIDDLRGSAGMYRLREELLMRVTEAAQPVRVRDVLFQEMLVQ